MFEFLHNKAGATRLERRCGSIWKSGVNRNDVRDWNGHRPRRGWRRISANVVPAGI